MMRALAAIFVLSLAGAIIRDRFRRPESAVAQKTSDVVCLIEAGATAGESPVWVAEEKALYWIDVYGPALYRAMTRQRATIGAGRSMSRSALSPCVKAAASSPDCARALRSST